MKTKKIRDNIMLFSLEAKYSEIKVKIIASKNEQRPTSAIYLPETVDLLLAKESPQDIK
jgi:hypothetical protein